VNGKQPEQWDPVTGRQRELPKFESKDGCTSIPLRFEPYGSMFVIFRKDIQKVKGRRQKAELNFPVFVKVQDLTGPWTVQFDPQWFYPADGLSGDQARGLMVFDKLENWLNRPGPAVHYYSGTAVQESLQCGAFSHRAAILS
jgi:hypothetical protein